MRKTVVEVDLEKLIAERNKNGYSFSDIAYTLGYKTPTGYWLIEHGERGVSVAVLYKLAKLYGKPMEHFIKTSEKK